jgi:superfamily II DNA or RNA helicase
MAGGGKAKSQVMQNVGRVLRIADNKKEALVYDFTDQGSRWLSEHSTQRQEIYKEYLP